MTMIAGRQTLTYESSDSVESTLLGVLYDESCVHGAAVTLERVEYVYSRTLGEVDTERTLIVLTVPEALKLAEHLTRAINLVLAEDENFAATESVEP